VKGEQERQKPEVRGQRIEIRGQRSEARGQKRKNLESIEYNNFRLF